MRLSEECIWLPRYSMPTNAYRIPTLTICLDADAARNRRVCGHAAALAGALSHAATAVMVNDGESESGIRLCLGSPHWTS